MRAPGPTDGGRSGAPAAAAGTGAGATARCRPIEDHGALPSQLQGMEWNPRWIGSGNEDPTMATRIRLVLIFVSIALHLSDKTNPLNQILNAQKKKHPNKQSIWMGGMALL